MNRSFPSVLLMRKSCCVSMDGLLNSRCKVLRSIPSWSASHWLVRPWRRSSSRIRLPMCICMVVAICALGYRIHINSDDHRQKRRRAISSPNCGRGIPLKGKTKMLAYQRTFAFVVLGALNESSTFQSGRNK